MSPADAAPDVLTILISYSRQDLEFADRLAAALDNRGFNILIDRRSLPYGEVFKPELLYLIRQSDAVVFVVSPASVSSTWCQWEVEQVRAASKRLIPIVHEPVPDERLPDQIREINLLSFTSPEAFAQASDTLADVLKTDWPWLKAHTRYGSQAGHWDEKGRPRDLLLRGKEIRSALGWAAAKPPSAPPPSSLQLSFFDASRRNNSARRARLSGLVTAALVAISSLGSVWDAVASRHALFNRGLDLKARYLSGLDPGPEQSARFLLAALSPEAAAATPLKRFLCSEQDLDVECALRDLGSVEPMLFSRITNSVSDVDVSDDGETAVLLIGLDYGEGNLSQLGVIRLSDPPLDFGEIEEQRIKVSGNAERIVGFGGGTSDIRVCNRRDEGCFANSTFETLEEGGPVVDAAVTYDGSIVAATVGRQVKIWKVGINVPLSLYQAQTDLKELEFSRSGRFLAIKGVEYGFEHIIVLEISPEGNVLGEKRLDIFEGRMSAGGRQRARLRDAFGAQGDVIALPFTRDQAEEETTYAAKVYSLSSGAELHALPSTQAIVSTAFGSNGRLVTLTIDGTVQVWHQSDAGRLGLAWTAPLKRPQRWARFSQDGTRVLVLEDTSLAHPALTILDAQSGSQLSVIRGDAKAEVEQVQKMNDIVSFYTRGAGSIRLYHLEELGRNRGGLIRAWMCSSKFRKPQNGGHFEFSDRDRSAEGALRGRPRDLCTWQRLDALEGWYQFAWRWIYLLTGYDRYSGKHDA